MSIFIYIFLISWNQALGQDETPTFQIENMAILNSTPNGGELGLDMNQLEEGMALNSEQDLKIIVDTPDYDQQNEVENTDPSSEELIQDQAQMEISSTDKKTEEAPPEETPTEGVMMDGDIDPEEISNFSPPVTQNEPTKIEEDSLNTSQSAVKKDPTFKKTFEFPPEKKDSSFPVMEFPKTRRNRSR